MKNNHNVEVYNNGHGNRIAFDFQGTRRVLTIEQAEALKESLEYGLAKVHLTTNASDGEGIAVFEKTEYIIDYVDSETIKLTRRR